MLVGKETTVCENARDAKAGIAFAFILWVLLLALSCLGLNEWKNGTDVPVVAGGGRGGGGQFVMPPPGPSGGSGFSAPAPPANTPAPLYQAYNAEIPPSDTGAAQA